MLIAVIAIFVVVCIAAAIIAHLDHRRLAALDRIQNKGPIPEQIERRPGDRGPVRGDRDLEAAGRT